MRVLQWFSLQVYIPKQVRRGLLISWLVSFSSILGLLSVFFILQPEVPLFYSLAQPQEYLSSKAWLFIFPGLSVAINSLHTFLLGFIKEYEMVLIELFVWTTVAVQVLLAIGLIRIIWLVL